jgi:biopolymer transport protein ExbB/TolQ
VKKVSTDNAFLTFLLGAVVTVIAFLALSLIGKEQYLYNFFFRFWPVQVMTSWLFFSSLLFVVFRFVQLGRERIILSEKLAVESLDTISPQDAKEISEVIPEKYRASLGFRRIGELLKGYLHGEEIVRLNQELSRRDVEQIEGGHLVLDALKQLIPVLGFLGTVIGLSLGMAKFPEISKSAGSIDQLRFVLKDFAASLSVAFDTTLLALGYTVVIVLISSLLRRREESFVSEVDEKARDLISKLMLAGEAGEPVESGAGGISAGIVEGMKEYFDGDVDQGSRR